MGDGGQREGARRASPVVSAVLGVAGGMVGGVVGYYLFGLLVSVGLYALLLPGALLGWGSGLAARQRSVARGVLCAVAALGLGLYCDWSFFPFAADQSPGYFLTHLGDLDNVGITLAMVVGGALLALWLGTGSRRA